MQKTNVLRILDKKAIKYNVHTYEWDENDLSGETVASKVNFPLDRVFKTLVAHGDKTGHIVFCIPVAFELDLKKVSAVSGNKKVELIKVKELLPLTGYIRGGCSPIGMKKAFPTYIDENALLFDTICVSAGQRGLQIELNPNDLASLIQAEFAALF